MISQPALRLSYIILSITLTVILISSPIIAVYSPSMVLKIGFASAAYATSENNDDDNNEGGGGEEPTIDATTDGEDEVDGDVQEEDNTEEQQLSSSTQEQEELDEDGGEEEEEQLAFMAGEICDDFEDNDGDGFIDLADADCAAPATQGTVTAPTTPPPTSVTNTTATNSTANTLAAGIAGLDRPYDLEKDCKTYEELGIPDPPLEPGDPPNVQWYDCPPGVGVRVPPRAADTTTTTTTTSGVEICDDFEDNDGDGFIDLADADCAAPATQGTVTAPTTPATPPLQSPPPPTTTTPQEPTQQEPSVEICDDFEDNDGDGFIDFLDNDCAAPSTLGTITAPTGRQQQEPSVEICDDFEDNDGDGLIDLEDVDCQDKHYALPSSTGKDGNIWYHYPDGTKKRIDDSGNTWIRYPDDDAVKFFVPEDGATIIMYPEGIWVAELPDGRMFVAIKPGSPYHPVITTVFVLYPNGTSTIIADRGSSDPSKRLERPIAPEAAEGIYGLLLAVTVLHPKI